MGLYTHYLKYDNGEDAGRSVQYGIERASTEKDLHS